MWMRGGFDRKGALVDISQQFRILLATFLQSIILFLEIICYVQVAAWDATWWKIRAKKLIQKKKKKSE
jgi:hypothetical protein